MSALSQDPTSDIAVLAKKGSLLVKKERERQEALKGQKNIASLEGTKMGDAMGLANPEAEEKEAAKAAVKAAEAAGEEENSENFKADSQYGDHMKVSGSGRGDKKCQKQQQ